MLSRTILAALPESGRLDRKAIAALVTVALTACLRKLLIILNAMVRQGTRWSP